MDGGAAFALVWLRFRFCFRKNVIVLAADEFQKHPLFKDRVYSNALSVPKLGIAENVYRTVYDFDTVFPASVAVLSDHYVRRVKPVDRFGFHQRIRIASDRVPFGNENIESMPTIGGRGLLARTRVEVYLPILILILILILIIIIIIILIIIIIMVALATIC